MTSPRALVIAHSARARDSALWRFALANDDRFDLVVPATEPSDETAWIAPWLATGRVIPLEERRISTTSQTSLLFRGLSSLTSSEHYVFAHIATEPWSLLALTTRRRLPIVIHGAETVMVDAPLRYRLRRVGARRVLRTAAGVAAWGHESLQEFKRSGVPTSTPKAVIPMGIPDATNFRPAPVAAPADRMRLLYVGRLVPEKGITDLLDAIIGDPKLPISLRIAGSGPHERQVIDAARTDDRVEYLGNIAGSEVYEQLTWCDASVVPSRITGQWTEQWGRSAVESLFVGRPIITSDSGELPWINPSPELVFAAADVPGIRGVLQRMASLGSIERARLAETALAHSAHFAAAHVYANLRRFWDEIFVRL